MAHLDIKPSNIMIGDNYSEYKNFVTVNHYIPKYIDFGLTCRTKTCDNLGTPGYMNKAHGKANEAREKLKFKDGIKSDYYALQKTLCELRQYKVEGPVYRDCDDLMERKST